MNYSRIYGAGKNYAEKLLIQFNPELTNKEAHEKAAKMYDSTKGVKKKNIWMDGTESEMFNKLEEIANSTLPKTPVLQSSITKCLEPNLVYGDVSKSKEHFVLLI